MNFFTYLNADKGIIFDIIGYFNQFVETNFYLFTVNSNNQLVIDLIPKAYHHKAGLTAGVFGVSGDNQGRHKAG